MADLHDIEGRPAIDYTARDYDSILRALQERAPELLPAWRDAGSEADFGNVLLQLFAHMGDVLSYYQDRIANESFLATARTRRSVIDHLRLIGYELATAAPAAAKLAVTVPLARATGQVRIGRGAAFATRSERDRPSVRFEYNGAHDLDVDLGRMEPDAGGQTKTFMLDVEEGRLVDRELLGSADGSPGQRFTLLHAPLILRSRTTAGTAATAAAGATADALRIVTQLGAGPEVAWTVQETLAFSTAGASDCVIEIDDEDRATIVFGDGVLGAKPEPGALLRATYRVGGGAAGNVGTNTIRTIADVPELSLLGAQVTNPAAAVGGSDREPIDHAIRHAPAVFRSLHRAVTAADYEALALTVPGVGKVQARAGNWNTVRLHVAPAGGGAFVSDVLRRALLEHFEALRPVSTQIDVVQVTYVDVRVTATIGLVPYFTPEAVLREVRNAAASVLAFDAVRFGQQVYLSRFYEVVEAVEGVLYANVTEFRRGDAPPDAPAIEPSGVIAIDAHELPRAPLGDGYDGAIRLVTPREDGA
jgi:Baseplate J-like protein